MTKEEINMEEDKRKDYETKTTRISPNFKEEFNDIRKERGDKISDRKLTSMVPRHNLWKKIKDDLIDFEFNNKGQVLVSLFVFLIIALVFILIIGIFVYVFGTIDSSLSNIDSVTGGDSIANFSEKTFGKVNAGMLGAADLIGILVLFGMVIGMILNGFLLRDKNMPLFFIIDFLLLIFAYILAIYISNAYETMLGTIPFSSVYIDDMSKSTLFLLRLPLITIITGVLTMIVTYAGIPKTKQEEIAGF